MESTSRPTSRGSAVEWLSLLALAAAVLIPPALIYSIRGEESRWARVAAEFREHHDWVVPRQQGQPFLSRPPLGSWLIAAAAWVRGDLDRVAVRAPSIIATLLTTILIYLTCRGYLNRFGAWVAAVAFASMAQVMELGSRAESEAVYTLFLGSALLLWYRDYAVGRNLVRCWAVGYGLAALAFLTKGPQAVAYFGAATLVYLTLRRDWRALVHPGHIAGWGLFALVVGAWAIPFVQAEGWAALRRVGSDDILMRFQNLRPAFVARHLISFPFELWGAALPGSLALMALLSGSVRRAARNALLLFPAVCLAVAIPTCWLVPGARPRYLMPLYPCLAVIIGWLAQHVLASVSEWKARGSVLVVAGTAAVLFSGIAAPLQARKSNNIGPVVAEFKTRCPDAKLVSFGPVWHQFAYHYREPIAIRPWPREGDDCSTIGYFCFDRWGQAPIQLPFEWEAVATFPGDRYRSANPSLVIVIGRRIPQASPTPLVRQAVQ